MTFLIFSYKIVQSWNFCKIQKNIRFIKKKKAHTTKIQNTNKSKLLNLKNQKYERKLGNSALITLYCLTVYSQKGLDLVSDTYSSGVLWNSHQGQGDITRLTRDMMKFLFTKKMVVPCLLREKYALTDTSLSTFSVIIYCFLFSVEALQTLSIHKSLVILLLEDTGTA